MEPHQLALNKVKIQLMTTPDSAFITTIIFSLKFAWDETRPTASTNGTDLKINPKFFMSLTPDERLFLLMHEGWHVAFQHMDRLMDRNHPKWNVAADHVINLMLIARGFKMPSMGLADPQYSGLSSEEVYNLIPDPDPSKVDMDIQPGNGTPEEQRGAIQDILVRASIQSKMQGDGIGSIPGEIQIFLDRLLNPKLPWQRIFHKYLHSMAKHDYSFRKPNRRYFPRYHLPSLHSESLIDLAIAVDASGSVSTEDFTQFVSETASIFKMMKPSKITLIQFDTDIRAVNEVKSIQELSQLTFTGRGGTHIKPVLQWANENKPKLLLVFTDGEFRMPIDVKSNMDTIWLIHNNPSFASPFGKVIHYEV